MVIGMAEKRDATLMKWVKIPTVQIYHLIYGNPYGDTIGFYTKIQIRKGDTLTVTKQLNGSMKLYDAGADPKKWYLVDGWYTWYNHPFDTLADAKRYVGKDFLKGGLNKKYWERVSLKNWPYRRD